MVVWYDGMVPQKAPCRAETASSAPKARLARQGFLAASSPVLARLETGTLGRHTRNRGPLVLGVHFQGQEAWREKPDLQGRSRSSPWRDVKG